MTVAVARRRRRLTTPAAEQNSTGSALKHRERVVHSDDLRDEVEIDEEQHDSKEDERERSRHEEDSTHLEQEDDCGDQTRLDFTENTQNREKSDSVNNAQYKNRHETSAYKEDISKTFSKHINRLLLVTLLHKSGMLYL